jgi:hypothetical protein
MSTPQDHRDGGQKWVPLGTPNIIPFVRRRRATDQAKLDQIERYLSMVSHDPTLSLEVRVKAVLAATYFDRKTG